MMGVYIFEPGLKNQDWGMKDGTSIQGWVERWPLLEGG